MSHTSSLFSDKSLSSTNKSGFGLIELMVSISIMVIVASIILTRQSSFNGAVLLRSEAYEIALKAREVQLGAVSSSDSDGGTDFRSEMGLNFSMTEGSNQQYTVFTDLDGDSFYNDGNEQVSVHSLDERFEIRDISSTGDSISGPDLSVVFVRPNFDAKFYDTDGGVDTASVLIEVARVGATGSGPGDVRIIEITSTGQIAVQ